MSSLANQNIRVLFCCTGVGIFNRGIESFFREAFDGLNSAEGIEARLVKGAELGLATSRSSLTPRPLAPDFDAQERTVWCLPRTGRFAAWTGRITGRSAYAAEQWSSFPGVVREIRQFRPHVVFTSEANLMFLLRRFRRLIGVPFRVLYSNGGPVHPPFSRHDVVQQVAPFYRDEALAAGEPPEKHFLVPYGIHAPGPPISDPAAKRALRVKLGLPADRPVVLSVGWIAKQHKRMDYVVREVARVIEMLGATPPRPIDRQGGKGDASTTPFLQLLGAMDEHSPEVIALADQQLGAVNFSAKSVRPDQVADYYRAADIFVLGSLAEGFGRVYLEALMHGLPTIGHRHPVIEYVVGDAGILADLSQPGALAEVLHEELQGLPKVDGLQQADGAEQSAESVSGSSLPSSHAPAPAFGLRHPASSLAQRRWSSVRDRFGWDVLRPQYAEMFRRAAEAPLPRSDSEELGS